MDLNTVKPAQTTISDGRSPKTTNAGFFQASYPTIVTL